MKLTKPQQVSLARKWKQSTQGLTYLEFRRTIQPTFGCDSAILVAWCGMWLGIETDGYCHS
jgi:hypothetical protein